MVEQFYIAPHVKILPREYKVGWFNVHVYVFKQVKYILSQGNFPRFL